MGRIGLRIHEHIKKILTTQRGIGRNLYDVATELDGLYSKNFPKDKAEVGGGVKVGSVEAVAVGFQHFTRDFSTFEEDDHEIFSDVHILEKIITKDLDMIADAVAKLEPKLKGAPDLIEKLHKALEILVRAAKLLHNEIGSEISSQRMDYFGWNFLQQHNLTMSGRIFHFLEKYARVAKVSISHIKALTKKIIAAAEKPDLNAFLSACQEFSEYVGREIEAFKTLTKYGILANILAKHTEEEFVNIEKRLPGEGYPEQELAKIRASISDAERDLKKEKFEYRIGKQIDASLQRVSRTLEKEMKDAS